jgi:hypothetical protein
LTSSPKSVIAACLAAVGITVLVVWGAQQSAGHGRRDPATIESGPVLEHPVGVAAVRGRTRWLAEKDPE